MRKHVQFYNSVSGGAYWRRLLSELELAGVEVEEISTLTGDQYRAAGGTLARVARRWRMWGAMPLRTVTHARQARDETIQVVSTNPFFLPALVPFALPRSKAKRVHLLYDLYPDALFLDGRLQPHSAAAALWSQVTRYALERCDATVFLGERLRQYAETRYGKAPLAKVIPVGADGSCFREFRVSKDGAADLNILYCGLFGRMHDVATVEALFRGSLPAGVFFDFHATGSSVRRLAGGRGRLSPDVAGRVRFGAALADAQWVEKMQAADVGLVSIARGAENVVMPSKTYSAMLAGQAILAICSDASDLADLIKRHDCGWVVEPGNVEGLRSLLETLAHRPDLVLDKRRNAYEAGIRHYEMRVVAGQWCELFKDLGKRP